MEGCKAELQRVELEERSNDYWSKHLKYEDARGKLGTAENNRKETEEALQGPGCARKYAGSPPGQGKSAG